MKNFAMKYIDQNHYLELCFKIDALSTRSAEMHVEAPLYAVFNPKIYLFVIMSILLEL